MEHKQLVREIISEIVNDNSTPVMKYYAFDWDDNLMYMPTKIYLKDDIIKKATSNFNELKNGVAPKKTI